MRRIAKGVHDFFLVIVLTIIALSITNLINRRLVNKKLKRINWDAILVIVNIIVIIVIFCCADIRILKDIFIIVCFIFIVNIFLLFKILRKQ